MCLSPVRIPIKFDVDRCDVHSLTSVNYMLVPCNKCVECLQDRQNAWIYRMFCEQNAHKHSLFVTLTYDPAHLPLVLNDGSNEIVRYKDYIKRKSIVDCEMTLYPRDLTNYFKRLRKKVGCELKYFACGEYGDKDGRPHYHFALFYDDCNPCIMESAIDSCWSMGFTEIDPLVENRIEYLTKYVTDKVLFTRRKDIQIDYFNRVSKGLGIKGFFEDEKHYGADFRSVMLPNGSVIMLPRYFRKKFFPKHEFTYYDYLKQNENISKKRAIASKRLLQDRKIQCGFEPLEKSVQSIRDRLDDSRRERILEYIRKRKKDF